MNQKQLANLARIAEQESPFTRLSLDGLADAETIQTQLEVAFEKSLRAKEGVKGLSERIQKVMGENITRAKTIAQTERTRALNGQRMADALKQYMQEYEKARKNHKKRPEVPRFQWVNPLYAKQPRHQHVAISGTVREAGEEFLPGLRYPGDPNAPASQTINCHCYIRRVK